MKLKLICLTAAAMAAVAFTSCNNGDNKTTGMDSTTTSATPNIKEEPVSYQADTITAKGYIAYDENKQGKRPAYW